MEPLFLSDHEEPGTCKSFTTKISRSVHKLCRIDNWEHVSWPNFLRKMAGLLITLFIGYVFFGVSYAAYRDDTPLPGVMPHEWIGLTVVIIYSFYMLIYWLSYDITTVCIRLTRARQ